MLKTYLHVDRPLEMVTGGTDLIAISLNQPQLLLFRETFYALTVLLARAVCDRLAILHHSLACILASSFYREIMSLSA